MTNHVWMSEDPELTDALRAHYATPSDERYWNALEARILARVARGADPEFWWSALADMTRPALAAAAVLVLVAGAAVAHTHQLEARDAYASVISAGPPSIETSARLSSFPDGDATINDILSH